MNFDYVIATVGYTYDVKDMDRVTNMSWRTSGGASLGGFAYEYDAVGRIVSRRHSLGKPSQSSQMSQSSQKNYTYDNRDRLASDGGAAYTYDAAGNRTTKTENGETVAYTLGVGDRLASWTDGAYMYDAAGCVTRIERDGRPTLDLTWNGQYQLVSVSTNGVFAEGYAYDALGRRVSTTTMDGTTRHVYDSNWQVIADLDENGNALVSYIWGAGIDNLLAVKIGGSTYYPLTDIQGTVWGYVDSQNNIVARWQYDAWGNVVDEEIFVPTLASLRYRFQGREWSAATGLINFRMRWYDAETGRWLSKDPIGLWGGINSYRMCGDNPLCFRDPSGLVDMNLFPVEENIRSYAELHNSNSNYLVGGHGNSTGVYDVNRRRIPVGELADRIREDSRFHGQTVQLDSCNVGNGPYAQQLANLLNVEVRASNRQAWYYSNGNVIYAGAMPNGAGPNFNDLGALQSFRPQQAVNATASPQATPPAASPQATQPTATPQPRQSR